MKLLIALLLTLISHKPHEARAQIFPAITQVQLTPTHAAIYVTNTTRSFIVCSGRVDGLTMSGHNVYSYLNGAHIPPGQYVFVHIYTHLYNPFVGVTPRVYCHYR